MTYLAIKHLHVTAVILSLSFFLFRGWCMVWRPRLLCRKWVRYSRDLIDTALLGSAIVLAIRLQQYPFVHDWLTAKVVALVVYIVLGSIALKRGRTRKARYLALGMAMMTAGYIVAVALSHHPQPWRVF